MSVAADDKMSETDEHDLRQLSTGRFGSFAPELFG